MDQLSVQIAIAIQQASAYQQAQLELAERQRIEKTLRESEERFRNTFEQAAVGISHVSLNGHFLLLNQRFCDIAGYPRSELLTLTFQNITHPDDLLVDLGQMQMLLTGTISTYSLEKRYIRKDRSIVWINLTVSLVRDAAESPQYFIAVIEDITPRKQAEQALKQLNQELETRVEQRTAALRESEERWQLVIQGTNDGIWDWDLKTNQIFFSTRWKEMRGFSEGEITNNVEECLSRIHPDDYDQVMQEVNDHFAQKTPFFQAEYRAKCKDDSYMWILGRGQALWDDAGNAIRMTGSETDITKRKRNEEQLRNLSDRLKLALQAGAIGTWDWDMLQEAQWDDRMYELYGMQLSQTPATYQDWVNVVDPDDLAEVEATLQAAIRGEKEFNAEFRVVHPDGSIHFIKAAAIVQRNDQGEPQRMVGINYDITERKTIELALRESERRYAALTQAAPVGIFRFDSSGNCIYANDRWGEIAGRPATAALETGWVEALHPEDRDRLFTKWSEWFQTYQAGETYCNEGRCLRPDGSITWFYCQILAETNADGKIISYIGTLTDITERKQAEAQLWQTNKDLTTANIELARATRLKDEFLANMSHELRTPLNAILGMSESLQDHVFGDINERQTKAIATIERSGKHLLELINDILDLSKIESGKLELDLSDVSVNSLCDGSLVFIRQIALKKKISLQSHIAHNLGSIQVDDRRMRQVLINLLNNAVKFTPATGSVWLKVWLQESGEEECAATVNSSLSFPLLCFSIIDTGIGIADKDISKLFQAFVQIDSSLNRQYEGTGLGLALVKRIVELHGGTITVSSEVGKGSCFTVRIPYHTSDNALKPRVNTTSPSDRLCGVAIGNRLPAGIDKSSSSVKSPVILLAEDNQANIMTIFDYLESRGYALILANNGKQAIDMAKTQCPDLIIMDIQMPEIDGIEAICRIRDDQQLVDIPIIALTALAMPGDKEICLAIGANEYLTKPVKLKQLAATIKQLLGK